MNKFCSRAAWLTLFSWLLIQSGRSHAQNRLTIAVNQESHIVLIGNNLGSRMMNFGHFETELHLRYPGLHLYIRNMSDPGDTPGFRPRSSRNVPWAFPGAEAYYDELATDSDSEGHFPSTDEWLASLEADIIIAFFGYSESFAGPDRLEIYREELNAFIRHTLSQTYNGEAPPRLVLVSPIAFEDLSDHSGLPDGHRENANLSLYTEAMREVSADNNVLFVDAFTPTIEWYEERATPLTIDGSQLTEEGYKLFSELLADRIFGETEPVTQMYRDRVRQAVLEKNWMWHNDYKIPNSVHAYGRRYDPFGPDNYPFEIAKIRQLTAIRDTAIWQAVEGKKMDLGIADARTDLLPEVETNYDPGETGHGIATYLYGQDALDTFELPDGYKIELFASESEFEDLANPVQISFDNKGRLWVAVMPTYPHYKPGDGKPNDKILILEDTDNDGMADKQITFADSLHLPVGFELAPEGVYVSQGPNLILLSDTDADDHADKKEILLSGFDDHDTHHAHSAYTADPSGAIYMGEGVFLHTNVETSYGTVRATNGGFYRYNPQRRRLERTAQLSIPNPWGIAFDRWGQNFFAETSNPDVRWMMPGTIKPRYGEFSPNSENLIEEEQMVRPTSGLEFVSSRHFPDSVQGDLLINNTIGFLGTKQHQVMENGTGYTTRYRQDLVSSSDPNFRPVDMEFAPDGSLYIVDWHNVLIGHMQHNARDPLRDHSHGRIYRVTYPSRPLLEPAQIEGASIDRLLDNLTFPEYRTRYRTRRELRGRDAEEVHSHLITWISGLDSSDAEYEHHLLEGLWVSWGLNRVYGPLLRRLLQSGDHRIRAAAVRVLRYSGHRIDDQSALLMQAAADSHGRVRLEAIVAASWLPVEQGLPVLAEAGARPLDRWMRDTYEAALAHLKGESVNDMEEPAVETNLEGADRELFIRGGQIFGEDGSCATCHQSDGRGLVASGFPPLAGAGWVTGSDERLIKIVLKGLLGPIEVLGETYPGQVPMTPFEGMLDDEEVAAVVTYVRNAFGNSASVVYPERVETVRADVGDKTGFYSPPELLGIHPMEMD